MWKFELYFYEWRGINSNNIKTNRKYDERGIDEANGMRWYKWQSL